MSGIGVCIQAGGRGERLRGLLGELPKALAPLGKGTLLDHQIAWARRANPGLIAVLAHDRIEAIQARLPPEILLIDEPTPLNTAGGLALLPHQPETWLVINVDHVSDIDPLAFLADHAGPATAAIVRRRHEIPEGVVELDGDRIRRTWERPVVEVDCTIGLYAFSRSALAAHLHGQPFSMPDLVQAMAPGGVRAWHHGGFWIDAGTPARLAAAAHWIERGEVAAAAPRADAALHRIR